MKSEWEGGEVKSEWEGGEVKSEWEGGEVKSEWEGRRRCMHMCHALSDASCISNVVTRYMYVNEMVYIEG